MAAPPPTSAQEHAINIRVMRLAKPSFATQYPLFYSDGDIYHDVSSASFLNGCGLGMALIVPQTFGMVHVGEDFSCLVSVFNESQSRVASEIALRADLQTQSQRTTLQEVVPITEKILPVGSRFDTVIKSRLTDIGAHILVCSISYMVEAEKLNFRKFFRFDVRRLADVRVRTFPTSSKSWFLEATLANTTAQVLWLESLGLNLAGSTVGSLIDEPSALTKLLKPQESLVVVFSIDRDVTLSQRSRSPSQPQSSLQPLPGQIALKFRSQFGDVASSDFLTQIPSDVCSQSKLLLKIDSPSDISVGNCIPVTFHLTNITTSNFSLNLELGTGSDFIGVGETSREISEIQSGGSVSSQFKVIALKPGFVNFPPLSLLLKSQHQYIRDLPNPMLTMFASVPQSGFAPSS